MVRLLVIFAPAYAILAAIGIFSLVKPFCASLKVPSKNIVKSKRKLIRVSREYSGLAILVIFVLLMTNLAVSPQTGGMPRSVSQAYTPTAISAASLPVGGPDLTAPIPAWLDAVTWLKENAKSTDVTVMWWDYGNWLSDLGNVTSLADNTTVNSTQIANVGFMFMGSEEQTMKMLSAYGKANVKYIAIFMVLLVQPGGTDDALYVSTAGYGDEGKWMWMARISGQDKQRFIDQGFISEADAWTDESSFGQTSNYGVWEWNERGESATIKKLMNFVTIAYVQLLENSGITVYVDLPDEPQMPEYFEYAKFAGIETAPFQYGGLVPVVAIFEVNWTAYNTAHP